MPERTKSEIIDLDDLKDNGGGNPICKNEISSSSTENINFPLKQNLLATCGRARRVKLSLPHSIIQTPVFMAVGTHGTIKGIPSETIADIGYQIILGNAYHLANRPGCTTMNKANGLHTLMNWPCNLLTDSGGFQMVSLLRLSEMTEKGVLFNNPVDGSNLLLTPEESIRTQNSIGADIIMALDDVVSAVHPDKSRVEESVERTTRWLDRCIIAHNRPHEQNLFGIVQGGLHTDLRLRSLADMRQRNLPGYAIGGLSGGEAKDDFWKIVELCTRPGVGLPEEKPRYLMGVGYPLDLVVCVALGVDMFDCVYPTRTARFGTALVPEGTMKLKLKRFATDLRPIQKNCPCEACCTYSRAFLHSVVTKETTPARLVTIHNLTYMFRLCEEMRTAIENQKFPEMVRNFLSQQFYTGLTNKKPEEEEQRDLPILEVASSPPTWVRDALKCAGIDITEMYDWTLSSTTARCGLTPHDAKPAMKKRSRDDNKLISNDSLPDHDTTNSIKKLRT